MSAEELRKLFFAHYMTPGVETYDELPEYKEVQKALQARVAKFDAHTERTSFISISLYQAEHITRLCRVLMLKRGHALLVGTCATGKRSIARLCVHMGQLELMEFDGYAAEEGEAVKGSLFERWRRYLRQAVLRVGMGFVQKGALLLRGSTMTEDMYDDLNCLLNGVEVPGLFAHAQQVRVQSRLCCLWLGGCTVCIRRYRGIWTARVCPSGKCAVRSPISVGMSCVYSTVQRYLDCSPASEMIDEKIACAGLCARDSD